jgi:SAM-dependent methyltransferase
MIGRDERKILKYRQRIHNQQKEYTEIDSRFIDYESNVKAWENFFALNEVTKEDRILDFGCAVGFSILVGRELGYNVRGLDVIYEGPYVGVKEYRKKYGTDEYIDIYDGYNIPYPDNSFTIIVGRTSFEKFNTTKRNDYENEVKELIDLRLKEFDRIITGKRLIVSNTNTFISKYIWLKYGFTPIIMRFK